MDMVGHNDKCAELVMAEFCTSIQGLHYQPGNRFLEKKQRASASCIQPAIHPDEGLAGGEVMR